VQKPDKDIFRGNLIKYTQKAFRMLPEMNKPCILDIGCGSGVPTMELARLSNGQIVGTDINQTLLDKLNRKIKEAGLTHRVETVRCSMSEMNFREESFDIIWAEGSIWVIGFKRGLKEWKKFLKSGGYLVIHDEIKGIYKKRKQISNYGYELLDFFTLSEDVWWTEYYAPMEKHINDLKIKYADEHKDVQKLRSEQQEIDLFKKNPKLFKSVFYILRRE